MTQEERITKSLHDALAVIENFIQKIRNAVLAWVDAVSKLDWGKVRQSLAFLTSITKYAQFRKRLESNRGISFLYRAASLKQLDHIIRLRLALE